MKTDDIPAENLHPQVCVSCGAWLRNRMGAPPLICGDCGYNNRPFADFYRLCARLDRQLEQAGSPAVAKLQGAWKSPLRYGWLPDLLAMVSAFVLGILTNAAYDVLKQWMMKRKVEFGQKYSPWWVDYDRLVEVVFDYVVDHIQDIKGLQFTEDEVSIQFRRKVEQLRFQIEKAVEANSMNHEDPTKGSRATSGSAPGAAPEAPEP